MYGILFFESSDLFLEVFNFLDEDFLAKVSIIVQISPMPSFKWILEEKGK